MRDRSCFSLLSYASVLSVHIVAIPKKHIPSLTRIDEEDKEILHDLLEVIQQVAREVENEYGACRVMTNLGEYQESKHLHWHIVSGDSFA